MLIYRNGSFKMYLLFGALGLHCSAPAPSSCGGRLPAVASLCGAGLQAPGRSRCGTWAQQAWHPGLGAPRLWGPPDQGLSLRPLHQQAHSHPLRHQLSPRNGFSLKTFNNNPWEEIHLTSSPVYTCIRLHVYILYTKTKSATKRYLPLLLHWQ